MRIKATILVAAAVALAGIAAGCGDDNNDSTTSAAETISKADFVAKANQICKQGNADIDQAGKQLPHNLNEAQLEDFASSTLVPKVQSQIDGVKALGAPAGEEAQVNKLLATVQADLDQLKADPSKIKDDHLFDDSDQQAKALGLNECAG
jgi:hypothetical protein